MLTSLLMRTLTTFSAFGVTTITRSRLMHFMYLKLFQVRVHSMKIWACWSIPAVPREEIDTGLSLLSTDHRAGCCCCHRPGLGGGGATTAIFIGGIWGVLFLLTPCKNMKTIPVCIHVAYPWIIWQHSYKKFSIRKCHKIWKFHNTFVNIMVYQYVLVITLKLFMPLYVHVLHNHIISTDYVYMCMCIIMHVGV